MALSKTARETERAEALDKVGRHCRICQVDEMIQLHHVYYAADSIRPGSKGGGQWETTCRVREAKDHPERFMPLCRDCHRAVTPLLARLEKINANEYTINAALDVVAITMQGGGA